MSAGVSLRSPRAIFDYIYATTGKAAIIGAWAGPIGIIASIFHDFIRKRVQEHVSILCTMQFRDKSNCMSDDPPLIESYASFIVYVVGASAICGMLISHISIVAKAVFRRLD